MIPPFLNLPPLYGPLRRPLQHPPPPAIVEVTEALTAAWMMGARLFYPPLPPLTPPPRPVSLRSPLPPPVLPPTLLGVEEYSARWCSGLTQAGQNLPLGAPTAPANNLQGVPSILVTVTHLQHAPTQWVGGGGVWNYVSGTGEEVFPHPTWVSQASSTPVVVYLATVATVGVYVSAGASTYLHK